jgi:hypothetical protein
MRRSESKRRRGMQLLIGMFALAAGAVAVTASRSRARRTDPQPTRKAAAPPKGPRNVADQGLGREPVTPAHG